MGRLGVGVVVYDAGWVRGIGWGGGGVAVGWGGEGKWWGRVGWGVMECDGVRVVAQW